MFVLNAAFARNANRIVSSVSHFRCPVAHETKPATIGLHKRPFCRDGSLSARTQSIAMLIPASQREAAARPDKPSFSTAAPARSPTALEDRLPTMDRSDYVIETASLIVDAAKQRCFFPFMSYPSSRVSFYPDDEDALGS